ncbi:BnaC09g30040D [Brassica napus]|uniref:BnaC09g30040D protein n=1 Tax=Brassica napus TaxID=3708 RepID=A0A078G101_BRANA|nr:BnaC09g30040D [Brassica napus]
MARQNNVFGGTVQS